MREPFTDWLRDLDSSQEVSYVCERLLGARLQDRTDLRIRDAVDVLQAEPDAVQRWLYRFDDVFGLTLVDVEGEDRDAVLPGVLEEQATRVHPGLVRQDSCEEVRGIVRLQPCGLIGRHGEGGCV